MSNTHRRVSKLKSLGVPGRIFHTLERQSQMLGQCTAVREHAAPWQKIGVGRNCRRFVRAALASKPPPRRHRSGMISSDKLQSSYELSGR